MRKEIGMMDLIIAATVFYWGVLGVVVIALIGIAAFGLLGGDDYD